MPKYLPLIFLLLSGVSYYPKKKFLKLIPRCVKIGQVFCPLVCPFLCCAFCVPFGVPFECLLFEKL